MLNDVEFREVQEVAIVDKVKIVACDGKSKYINFAILCICITHFFTCKMFISFIFYSNFIIILLSIGCRWSSKTITNAIVCSIFIIA